MACFDALANELDKWWCHRVAPRAALSLEAREGGRFLQTAGQHLVDYARVAQLQRPRLLQFEGSFGMEAGAHNVLTLLLEPKDGGTTAFSNTNAEARPSVTLGPYDTPGGSFSESACGTGWTPSNLLSEKGSTHGCHLRRERHDLLLA
jgi:hypothetical protein